MVWEYCTTYRGIDIYVYMPGATNYMAYINGGYASNLLSVVMAAIDAYLEPEPEPEPEPDPRIPQFIETYRGLDIYYIPYFNLYTAKSGPPDYLYASGATLSIIRAKIDKLLEPKPDIATALTINLTQTPPVKPGSSLTFPGKLTRPDTGAGLAGQTVDLEQPPGTKVKSGTTNSAGNYSITVTAPTTEATYKYRTNFAGAGGYGMAVSKTIGVGIANWWDAIKARWNDLAGWQKAIILTTSLGSIIIGGASALKKT